MVSVHIEPDGSYDFIKQVHGDSVGDVLSYIEYDEKDMLASFAETAAEAKRCGLITDRERQDILHAYDIGLRGYTYFES